MRELSLRPYNGRLFIAKGRKDYEASHRRLFKTPDVIACDAVGRFNGGEGHDGMWTYLIWADTTAALVHELSHAVLHTFERCGIDPRAALGEPFCYMLSQLVLEAAAVTQKS